MQETLIPQESDAIKVGMSRAEGCTRNADRAGFDSTGAADHILSVLRHKGDCSGEELVMQARDAGFVPHDDRAFGSVFAGLKRKGLIATVGNCTRRRGHGTSGGRIWSAIV